MQIYLLIIAISIEHLLIVRYERPEEGEGLCTIPAAGSPLSWGHVLG